MFANIGWGEMLVLVVVGLVVLGPERLPGAIRWSADALRQARDYLSGMTTQLREDIGPEFDDLREPLSELQKLRGMTPRAALTKHLLDGNDSLFTGRFDRPSSGMPGELNVVPAQAPEVVPAQAPAPLSSAASEALAGGPVPFDTDAT